MQSSLQKVNDNPKSFRLIKISRIVVSTFYDIVCGVDAIFNQRVVQKF